MKTMFFKARSAILLLCTMLAIAAITSCEKDLYDDALKSEAKGNLKRMPFDELDSKTSSKISEKARKFEEIKNSLAARAEYDSIFDMMVDYDEVEVLVKNEKEYYSFPAYKMTDDFMKNVVFTEKSDGTWGFYVVDYEITEEAYKQMSEEQREGLDPKLYEIMVSEGRIRLYQICDITVETYTIYGYMDQPQWTVTEYHYSNCHWEFQGQNDSMNWGGPTTTGGTTTSSGSGSGGVHTTPYIMSPAQVRRKNFTRDLEPDEQQCLASFDDDTEDDFFSALEQ